ncbi:hypothetical protein MJL79_29520, partial [Salmonella enterica subsp. enterica serovar Montevideo]|nr:hypothetical protein [Salmonella enterica subsp. enterica serovar Montevideo]
RAIDAADIRFNNSFVGFVSAKVNRVFPLLQRVDQFACGDAGKGKSKRALHILQQLRLEGSEPVILLRTLQRELLLLVNLKRQSA